MSCLALSVTVSALVGKSLAPIESLATLPIALQFAGTLTATIPASLFMGRFGRRAGFTVGAGFGMAAGGLCAWAIIESNFYMFCAGSILLGMFAGHAAYYRFAAADTANEEFKSKAISWVMAGGVVSAFLGPEMAKYTRDLFADASFAGGYLAVVVFALLSLVLVQFLLIARPVPLKDKQSSRPWGQLLGQPVLILAVACGMVGYGAMNLIMVPTPLAIEANNLSFETIAFVIQAHVFFMFAPSFFTGNLIQRFGVLPIIGVGGAFILACIGINLTGQSSFQFWMALACLGIGWNFMYIGGTTLLTETYRPEEQTKVQAFNDFLVFGTTVATAFVAGFLFNIYGWSLVNLVVILPVGLVIAVIVVTERRRIVAMG